MGLKSWGIEGKSLQGEEGGAEYEGPAFDGPASFQPGGWFTLACELLDASGNTFKGLSSVRAVKE